MRSVRLLRKPVFLVAHKPDSQDICFVPDGDYASFIEEYRDTRFPEGNFVTADGKVIGTS